VRASLDQTALASALERLDALCALTLERAAPLRFAEARDSVALEATYRLRYRAVIDQSWGRPEEYPGGMERDEYDDVALHVAGWDGDQLVATARLVFPAPGLALPTEAAFDLVVEPRGEVVDLGRLVVARAYRGASHRMLLAILARSWLSIRERGLFRYCAIDSRAMIRLYRRLGFEVVELGEARIYWGEERLPVLFDVAASEPALTARFG
jgi:N-acyl-L-homoserine lactone synthetase